MRGHSRPESGPFSFLDRFAFGKEKPLAKPILLDQFHIDVLVPRRLPADKYAAMKRILDDAKFQTDLRRAVRAILLKHPVMKPARVRLSR